MSETSDPMSDNAALNAIVAQLEELNATVAGKYDSVLGDNAFGLITSAAARVRAAVPLAVKTVITNKGPNSLMVRENGVLVLVVPANNTVEEGTLPLTGAGSLNFSVASAETANITVATYQNLA
jgi:hypothetical protein